MKRNPRVYVTQIPHRRDAETGTFVPTVNIAPATEHGEVKVIMPPRASFFATAELTRQLRDALRDYDAEAGDSIVVLGDPAVIAVACAILGKEHGNFIILKWDRNIGRYIPHHIHI